MILEWHPSPNFQTYRKEKKIYALQLLSFSHIRIIHLLVYLTYLYFFFSRNHFKGSRWHHDNYPLCSSSIFHLPHVYQKGSLLLSITSLNLRANQRLLHLIVMSLETPLIEQFLHLSWHEHLKESRLVSRIPLIFSPVWFYLVKYFCKITIQSTLLLPITASW